MVTIPVFQKEDKIANGYSMPSPSADESYAYDLTFPSCMALKLLACDILIKGDAQDPEGAYAAVIPKFVKMLLKRYLSCAIVYYCLLGFK